MSIDNHSPRRVSRILVIVVAAIVVVAGIIAFLVSQQQSTQVASGDSPSSQAVSVPSAKDLKSVKEKVSATVLKGCTATSDGKGWVATGTVTNEGDEEQTFLVTAYFVADDKPVNFAQSRVVVPAGKSAPWVAVRDFPAQDSDLTCEVVAVS